MSAFDTQVNTMYAWEQAHRHLFNTLDEAVIPLQIEMACEYFDVDAPTLRYNVNLKRKAHYTPRDHRVTLAGRSGSWSHNQMVVLHEVAHAIQHIKIPKVEPHGPEFVGILIMLIRKFTKVHVEPLLHDAARRGLQIKL